MDIDGASNHSQNIEPNNDAANDLDKIEKEKALLADMLDGDDEWANDDVSDEQLVAASQAVSQNTNDDDEEEDLIIVSKKKRAILVDEDEDDATPVRQSTTDENDNPDEFLDEAEDELERSPIKIAQAASIDDDNEIDIGALKAKYDAQIFNDDEPFVSQDAEGDQIIPKEPIQKVVTKVAEPKAQKPFQISSTPVYLEQRFMVWNDVGIVRCYSTDDENSIDVEFHDSATYHPFHLENSHQYTMADLSSRALVLANKKVEGTVSSRLFCKYFRTWDSNKEWKVDMPEDEYIDCITIGNDFVTAATDKRFIRIFTIGGIQLNIISVPGSIVTLAAQERSLLAVFQNGCPLPDDQNMAMYFLKVDSHSALIKKQPYPNSIPVALSPKTLLTWAGFTDEGTPCTIDLSGVVRLYNKVLGNTWMPVLNLRSNLQSKSDHNWVIGISEIQQQVRCVFCKGQRYPATVPRPLVATLAFELPLCEKTTTRGKFEEKHLRSKITNHMLTKLVEEGYDVEQQLQSNVKEMSESLLRVFAMAIGSNCEALALEISYLMPTKKIIDAAIRYALQKKCTALAEKLGEVALQKESEEVEDGDQEEEEQAVSKPSPNKDAVVFMRTEDETCLKPKPLRLGRRNDDSDDEEPEMSLRPKSLNLKKKRNREEDGQENDSRSQKLTGFDLYFEEMYEMYRSENTDMDKVDLREVARDGYDSLEAEERKEWAAKAKEATKSKKIKV
ncbi:WD repeat and HMG-box DNA-binding protein 1 [Halotydeus destructor]|nr:WD repeat and HMG-box DNA-binding protein 1 [Halotydeus destructor]